MDRNIYQQMSDLRPSRRRRSAAGREGSRPPQLPAASTPREDPPATIDSDKPEKPSKSSESTKQDLPETEPHTKPAAAKAEIATSAPESPPDNPPEHNREERPSLRKDWAANRAAKRAARQAIAQERGDGKARIAVAKRRRKSADYRMSGSGQGSIRRAQGSEGRCSFKDRSDPWGGQGSSKGPAGSAPARIPGQNRPSCPIPPPLNSLRTGRLLDRHWCLHLVFLVHGSTSG